MILHRNAREKHPGKLPETPYIKMTLFPGKKYMKINKLIFIRGTKYMKIISHGKKYMKIITHGKKYMKIISYGKKYMKIICHGRPYYILYSSLGEVK